MIGIVTRKMHRFGQGDRNACHFDRESDETLVKKTAESIEAGA